MLNVFLKQASPMLVRGSIVVLLISILLASWFISHRETDKPSQKTEKERLEKEDILPKLTRIDPMEVGYVRELNLVPGKVHKMRTLSLRPALFEIEDFLTEQECDNIILMAKTQGLERSQTLGEQSMKKDEENANNNTGMAPYPAEIFQSLDADGNGHLDTREVARGLMELGRVMMNEEDTETMMSDLDMDPNKDGLITYDEFEILNSESRLKEMRNYLEKIHETNSNKRTRDSSTAFLDAYEHIDFRPLFESLRDRIHLVTHLPKDMIWSSEHLQVIRYQEKQHYHCHFDSEEEEEKNLPCCHQVEILYDLEESVECIPCRYLTFFYYLNDPELGGETAFPIADNETLAENKTFLDSDLRRCDLAEHCYDANLYYKPKRGTALLWYNHFVSNETGWLGPIDQASYHGGCNVLQGTKWAANNWINAGKDREIDLKVWEEIRLMEEDYQERMRREPWEEQTREKESNGNVEQTGEEKAASGEEKESSKNEKTKDQTREKDSYENERHTPEEQQTTVSEEERSENEKMASKEQTIKVENKEVN